MLKFLCCIHHSYHIAASLLKKLGYFLLREGTLCLVPLTPSNNLFLKNNYEMKHRAKLSSYPVSNLITYLSPSLGQSSGGMLSNAAVEAELTTAMGFLLHSCLSALGWHHMAGRIWCLKSATWCALCNSWGLGLVAFILTPINNRGTRRRAQSFKNQACVLCFGMVKTFNKVVARMATCSKQQLLESAAC